MRKLFTLLPCMFALALFAGEPTGDKSQKKLTDDVPVLMQMLRVKDPVTGKIRKPTPEELRLLMPVNPLDRANADLVEKKHKKGGGMLNLRGTMQSATVAKIGPDGKVVTSCVNTDQEMRRFIETPVAKEKEASRDQ
ncbi:MAG: hypothetical protein QNK37_24320 [Acidobacteriota bacterium]|nr:hypothetical protein [Acidobacteriota bacterium]